jgi:hypothetical protein
MKHLLSLLLVAAALPVDAQWMINSATQAGCEKTAAVAGPAGGTIACTAASMVTQVADVVPPKPSGGVSILAFGAVCDGATDNGTAIAKTIIEAKAKSVPVLIPAGSCAYGDVITLEGVRLQGSGDASILYALNPERAAITLTGSGSEVRSVRMSGKASKRSSKRESSRIVALGASNWVIDSVLIDNAAGAGVHVTKGANHGVVSNNRIIGTLADAIHITGQSSYIQVIGNTVQDSGDDGVAVVSYQGDGGITHHVTARNNTITDNRGGRSMSVVGGSDIVYEENRMTNNVNAACLYLSQENSYKTYGVSNVLAQFNTLTNCGNKPKGHAAVMLFSDGAYGNASVRLYRNDIVQTARPQLGGIRIFGPNTEVVVDSNQVTGASPPLNIATPRVAVTPYTTGRSGVR